MGEIINLRRARKVRARDDASRQAAANRAAHGRTKAEKVAEATEQVRRNALLDGAKRTTPDETAAGEPQPDDGV